jgi:small subunit ribosomal protein S13
MYLLGINVPEHKLVHIALQSIHGIGLKTAQTLCHKLELHPQCRLSALPEQKVTRLSQMLNEMNIDVALKKETAARIRDLYDIGCYRGIRHFKGLPTKGQRTKTNANTAKRNGRLLRASINKE